MATSALAADPAFEQLKTLFDYDRTVPIGAHTTLSRHEPGVKISNFTFTSPMGGRVGGYLVEPDVQGRGRPGILFGHDDHGDRAQFLPEAAIYARAGAVSILVDYPWMRPMESRRELLLVDGRHDLDIARQAVVDLRRAIDILSDRIDIDAERIAYVGRGTGARWGAILAAVDKRIKTCVLMEGQPQLADLYEDSDEPEMVELRKRWPADQRAAYLTEFSKVDAVHYVPHAAPVSLYFQFARFDRFAKARSYELYAAAGSQPKRISWYDSGPDLNDPHCVADRAVWLEKEIRLEGAVASLLKSLR